MSAIRTEPRIAMMATVEVSWVDQTGTPRDVPATMEDKSVSGACIRIKSQVIVGALVTVAGYREQFAGVAKYCRRERDAYLVGLLKDTAAEFDSTAALSASPPCTAPLPEGADRNVHLISTPKPPDVPKGQDEALVAVSNEIVKVRALPAAVPFVARVRPFAPKGPNRMSSELVSTASPVVQFGHDLAPAHNANLSRGAAYAAQLPSVRSEKERIDMPNKWTDLAPWRKQSESQLPDAPIAAPRSDAKSNPGASADDAARAKISAATMGDLLSMDDIYRAAGILTPRMGYSILKVADMLASDHLRGLADELKRGSVLMALDAAGISVDEVLSDAGARQSAVNSYESDQWQHFEEHWASKAAENVHTQAELERITAQYQDRIKRNLDEVAQERIVFAKWQTMKQEESQRIGEATAICAKPSATESFDSATSSIRSIAAGSRNA